MTQNGNQRTGLWGWTHSNRLLCSSCARSTGWSCNWVHASAGFLDHLEKMWKQKAFHEVKQLREDLDSFEVWSWKVVPKFSSAVYFSALCAKHNRVNCPMQHHQYMQWSVCACAECAQLSQRLNTAIWLTTACTVYIADVSSKLVSPLFSSYIFSNHSSTQAYSNTMANFTPSFEEDWVARKHTHIGSH